MVLLSSGAFIGPEMVLGKFIYNKKFRYGFRQCSGAGAGSSNIFVGAGAGSGAVFFVKNGSGSGLAKNDFLK